MKNNTIVTTDESWGGERAMPLRPCPFCGDEDVQGESGLGLHYILCLNCGAMGPNALALSAAGKRWNHREEADDAG